MSYDFNNAERNDFDLIPAKTVVPVRVAVLAGDAGTPENAFAVTKSGLHQLALELTVTEGDYAKRKIWQRLTMGAQKGVELTEGQERAIAISGSTIRAMLEAGRGVAPTDDSAQAITARKMESLFELDGLEFFVEIGIEKDKTGAYPDKNRIAKVMPAKSVGAKAANAPAKHVASAKKAAWAQ